MIQLICKQCGEKMSITEDRVILYETSAQVVRTQICDYCGCRYAMGDELPLATRVDIIQVMDISGL